MRTLLPILRNILFIVVSVMAVLMALSAMGVQIAPLIAGAGVVGVAVGFGAQTLVKDVISGIFYLLDDAFRVGEYIISGSYKGTVESFSLRSIKLRHHRGYLYTVPFGSLGAVQNMSRDWVIDKLTLSVTYDTDLDKVKRIIKQVGKELLADPALAPRHHRDAEDAGCERVWRLRDQGGPEAHDPAGRAVHGAPPGLRTDQEGVRGERHRVRRPDGAGRRRRADRRRGTRVAADDGEARRRLILDQLAVSSRQRVMPARSRCIATARPLADASAPTALSCPSPTSRYIAPAGASRRGISGSRLR